MKTVFLPILLGGALLPLSQVQGKTYGGFTSGHTFTLKVTEKKTTRVKGDRVARGIGVPDSMPDFHIGEKVTFTIGSNGQLKGPRLSISYEGQGKRLNLYSNNPSFRNTRGEAATVSKTSSGEATGATLTFYKFRFSGFIPVTTTVRYVLE